MANKDPAFLFYTADFYAGVSDLTMEERGQYITLLCLQHLKGHLSKKNMQIAVGSVSSDVLAKFTKDQDGLYYNERLEIEANKRKSYCEKQAENIKKRWEKGNTVVDTVVLPTNIPSENENINVNKSINENINVNIVNIDLFNKLWVRYPRKINKKVALDAFNKLNPDAELVEVMLKAINKARTWKRWEDEKYIPHFSTWLNQRRWEDEIPDNECSNFDTDDFFNAAISRSDRMFRGEK